jgi:general secretion pathway protein G
MIETYRRMRARRSDVQADEGFTLIEILIVIVCLGILAAVVIFALGGITGKSAKAACAADGATVSNAISTFETQNPTTTVTQSLLLPAQATTANGGPYLQSWPNNAPHYIFAIIGGVLYVNTSPTDQVSTPPTAIAADLYNGPGSCSNVS